MPIYLCPDACVQLGGRGRTVHRTLWSVSPSHVNMLASVWTPSTATPATVKTQGIQHYIIFNQQHFFFLSPKVLNRELKLKIQHYIIFNPPK